MPLVRHAPDEACPFYGMPLIRHAACDILRYKAWGMGVIVRLSVHTHVPELLNKAWPLGGMSHMRDTPCEACPLRGTPLIVCFYNIL